MKTLLLLAAAAAPGIGTPAPLPARFAEAPLREASPVASADWWTLFADAQLDALIARGRRANADVAVAAARVSIARAALRGSEAERMPRLGGAAGLAGQTGTLINAAGGTGALFQLGAGASYEIDVLGRLSKTARAAGHDARAAEMLMASARLIAEADIAQTYFTLRQLDAERAIVERGAADAARAVAIAEQRQQQGLGSQIDAERLRGELGAILADRAAIDRDRASALHALALLVGDGQPVELAPAPLAPLPAIPAGLPSEMLTRRPDVAASVDTIRAAELRLGATRSAWFPSIGLTASGGQASTSLASLLTGAAQTFGFNLLLALPIFDGGRHKAAVARSRAELELSEAENRQIVLRAFREVEDQLSALRLLAEAEQAARSSVEADDRARAIAGRRFAEGAISRLEWFDVERESLAGARRLSQLGHARYVATVNLIRALGGGWAAPATTLALPGESRDPVLPGSATRTLPTGTRLTPGSRSALAGGF